MKAEYINAFYLATQDVFRLMLDLETTRLAMRVTEELVPFREANVVIGVTGDLAGSLLYSFPKNMALEMVRIMSGMEMTELDAFVTSAMGELANIISGNAMTRLFESNFRCDIVPPQILIGGGQSLSMATPQAIVLQLQTSIGAFEVSISLRTAKS
ncbi:MAG TPA: chemotaxis protein CheX [Firmicutes bacterium]|jgi:chemotaxis protein CheX|nr:MAG: chemotaxis protein CheC [Peptococcaceae bacterium 1109]HHT72122.1 chemotaxis protein CheX [Bacillota bacterium]